MAGRNKIKDNAVRKKAFHRESLFYPVQFTKSSIYITFQLRMGSQPYTAVVGFGMYLGSDSTGFEIKNPFNPAAFSPCLPNPNPANLSCVVSAPVLPSLLILPIRPTVGLWVDVLPPVYKFEMKEGGPETVVGIGIPATWDGRALLACSRQEVRERLDLADWRNISPRRTLTHPREKRKKAETRVKVSTRCERIAAPILEG